MTVTDMLRGVCTWSSLRRGCRSLQRRPNGGPGAPRTDAGRRASRSSPGGDSDGRPGSVLAAGASSFDRAVLRVRSPSRARGGPVHHRRGRHRRPPRRRRRGRVLPRRDGRLRIRRREILHHRRPSPARHARRDRGAQRDPCIRLSLRFGLHWGATLYIGRILTAGRSEVTALGDEMNEAARIEACATGGRTLASKSLIERLDRPTPSARARHRAT